MRNFSGTTPTLADHNPGTVPAGTETHMALLVATILLAVIGLALSIRTFARWCGKAGSQLNIGARLALRDAAEHHRRFVPAACAVLITMCIASYTLVITGSMVADQRNSTMTMTYGPSGMAIGADVPVSNEFDRAVVSDAIHRLGKETPIRAHYPVYTEDVKRWSKLNDTTEVDSDKLNAEHGYMYAAALLPAGHTCDNPTIQEQPDTSTWVGSGCRFGPVPKRSDTLCADRPVLSANVFEYTVEIQRRESHYGKRFVKGVFSHVTSKIQT